MDYDEDSGLKWGLVQQRADVAMIAQCLLMTPNFICKYRRKNDENKRRSKGGREELLLPPTPPIVMSFVDSFLSLVK